MSRRVVKGKGFFDAVKSVNSFLRNNKVISRVSQGVANVANKVPGYGTTVGTIAQAVSDESKKLGYGKKKPGRPRKVGRPKGGSKAGGAKKPKRVVRGRGFNDPILI